MRRSDFLGLMLSPLLAPFVKAEKPFWKRAISRPRPKMTEYCWYDRVGDNHGTVTGVRLMDDHRLDAMGYYLSDSLHADRSLIFNEIFYKPFRINKIKP